MDTYGLTLVVTDNPECPGVNLADLVPDDLRTTRSAETLGAYLFQQQGIIDFLTEHRWSSGTRVMLISHEEPLLDPRAPHLTFPVGFSAFRTYKDVLLGPRREGRR